MNEGIPREEFSVRYSSFDEAVVLVRSFGKGAFMAKLDIKHAFRLCPVRVDQWSLLGFALARYVLCGYSSSFWFLL